MSLGQRQLGQPLTQVFGEKFHVHVHFPFFA